jgi:copper(I)-binding protein
MFGLTRIRIVEIGVALVLTLAALLFVGLTVWAAELTRIEVADAWARPTGADGNAGAAYMIIANKGKSDDLLKSARTSRAKSVELQQATMTVDGVKTMRRVEHGLPVEAGASLVLKPGEARFMLVGLEDALEAGEQLVITLEFAKAGVMDVVVPVSEAAPATASAQP